MVYLSGFLLLLVLAVFISHFRSRAQAAKTAQQLTNFKHLPTFNCYQETTPKISLTKNNQKFPHFVLLLHGFGSAPHDFDYLCTLLDAHNIPYYAPVLTGHGLSDLHIFEKAQRKDWLRDTFNAYDIAAVLGDKVSVIAHSTGTPLAIHLAQHKPLEHLIITGPNLAEAQTNHFLTQILMHPLTQNIFLFTLPYYTKPIKPNRVTYVDTCDPAGAKTTFSYRYLPLKTVLQMSLLRANIDLSSPMHIKDLTILYGKQDLTVNVQAGLERLKRHGIAFKAIPFERSGHNLLKDYDKDEAVKQILEILAT